MRVTSRPHRRPRWWDSKHLIGLSDHSSWLNLRPGQSNTIDARTDSRVRDRVSEAAGTNPKGARIGKGEKGRTTEQMVG